MDLKEMKSIVKDTNKLSLLRKAKMKKKGNDKR
jgi:hypothetical protein